MAFLVVIATVIMYEVGHIICEDLLSLVEIELLIAGASCCGEMRLFAFPIILRLLPVL